MLMTIDVGNTNITLGVFDGEDLRATFRMTTKAPRTSDELGAGICNFLMARGIPLNAITDAVISSVVPKVMHSLTSALRRYFSVTPLIIGPGVKTGIRMGGDNPRETGADRIVNVAAAYHTYKKACLVLDFGTATTYDYVSDQGVFEYTVISPGLQISAQALWSQTAKLPEVEIVKPAHVLARNTVNGMQSGLVYGYIGQVEYIVRKIKEELGVQMTVLATGGLGRMISRETSCIDFYDPHLAFKGMKIIYEKNRPAAPNHA